MIPRRATPDDGPAVSTLITNCGGTPKFRKRFGAFNVAALLECGYLPLVVTDEENACLAFVVLGDAPRCAPHLGEKWLDAFAARYLDAPAGPGNTLFVEFCAAVPGGAPAVATAFSAAARHLPAVDHLVLQLQPKAEVPEELAELFPPAEPFGIVDGADDQVVALLTSAVLSYCPRDALVPTLLVRDACVEDSDDLLPVFEAQSEVLAANFGDFFLAEIIEAQDEQNRAVCACDGDGRAVGLLAASTDVDVAVLREAFRLEPFGDLVKTSEAEAPLSIADDVAPAPAPAAAPAPAPGLGDALAEAPAAITMLGPAEASNVLAITLFCLDEMHESRAKDFFATVFALFPDREYCAVTAPPTAEPAAFLRDFQAVPPKMGSTFAHALFLLHRDALAAPAHLRVRRFRAEEHGAGVERLLGPGAATDALVEACSADDKTALDESPQTCGFVGLIGEQVVAVASASRKTASTDAVNWFKCNYHIEDAVPFERHRARAQASLLDIAVNPIFNGSARFVVKEVMRLYDKTVLYHEAAAGADLPPPVVRELVPVAARKRPTPGPGEELLGRMRPRLTEDPEEERQPAHLVRGSLLHYFKRSLASDRKTDVHARIVVVGFSCCAVGLLKALLFEPDLALAHVTLIAPNGLDARPGGYVPADEDFPPAFEIDALGLGQRLRVVRSEVAEIDRATKAVLLPDGARVLYDVLVLTCGLQESSPRLLEGSAGAADALDLISGDAAALADWGSGATNLAPDGVVPLPHLVEGGERAPAPAYPSSTKSIFPEAFEAARPDLGGFVSLSADDAAAQIEAELASGAHDGGVVVYGGGVAALAAARGLLDAGVAPASVTLVAPGDALESLGDANADRVARRALDEAGVALVCGLTLAGLEREGGALVAARFRAPAPAGAPAPASEGWPAPPARAPERVVDVPCSLILGAAPVEVGGALRKAVNEAGLVFDGRLVVDAEFRTTDPSIFAAGRHTKFSNVHRRAIAARGGGPTALYHERYNSLELGAYLGRCVLAAADPGAAPPAPAALDDLPDFAEPRCVSAALPGGLHYCRAALPDVPPDCTCLPTGMLGNDRANALLEQQAAGGGANAARDLRDLAAARDKYTVLKLDAHGVLCELVYLGATPVEARNLAALVGAHEAYLNSAALSYERGIVDDWVAFFRADWAAGLKHDRFGDLRKTLADACAADEGAREVLQMLLAEFDAGKDPETIRQLRAKAIGVGGANLPPETRVLLQNAVLGFLRKNRALLPRFALPEKPKPKA